MRNWRRYILAGLAAAFLVAFLVVPILLVIGSGLVGGKHYPGYWVRQVFADLHAREGLLNSLKVAAVTTLGASVLGLVLALLVHRYEFPGKRIASALVMLPMILPPFVGALAIRKILAEHGGSLNLLLERMGLAKVDWLGSGFAGVVVLEVLHLYPIMYLNASAALANVDPTMVEAARNLGASRWRTFWRVTLPLIRPGLFAGGTIVFIWSFTELGTPLMLNYNVLPVEIYRGFQEQGELPQILGMVFVLLSASVGFYGVGRFLFGRGAAATAGRGVAAVARRASGAGAVAVWTVFGAVTLVAIVPHVGVILMAFASRWGATILPEGLTLRHVGQAFSTGRTWNSVVNSLRYASLASAVDILLGLTIAWLVVRARVRGRSVLDSLAMLPLAVPGLVIAGGYVALTAWGPLVAIGPWSDPTLILVIAYSVRRLPYMVRSVSAGLQQTSETLEEAARNLGAGPLRTFLRITVPLISANVLAGAILTFSFSMLEVSDSLILAQTEAFYPITKEIYMLRDLADGPMRAAALGVLGMLLLTGTLVAANLLLGKRLGAMFRA